MQQACPSVRLSVCRQNAKKTPQKLRNLELVSIDYLQEVVHGLFKEHIIGPIKSKMAEIRHLENDMTSFYSAEGGPIWIKFCRLVQNDLSTAVIWPKQKPEVEFQYGVRLGEFNGLSSQSHLPHCRVLLLGEFTVMIPEPHTTLQGSVTWRNECHDRATLHGVRIPSAILKIVFLPYFIFVF